MFAPQCEMPVKYTYIFRSWVELRLRALDSYASQMEEFIEDARESQFNLFYEIGVRLFGRSSGEAMDYAMYFVERRPRYCRTFTLDPPLLEDTSLEVSKDNC